MGNDVQTSSTRAKNFSKAADYAGKAFVAAAGFVEGMMSELQKAQVTMVNSGVLFNDMGEEFQDVTQRAANAGLKYSEAADIAAQYGMTIASMGSNVTSGLKNTLTLLDGLNDATDAFGDFGTLTPELYAEFLQFVEGQRLQGNVRGDINRVKNDLQEEFIQLKMEAAALSHATGLSAQEIVSSRLAMEQDPQIVAIEALLDRGATTEAREAFDSFKAQFATLNVATKDAPELVNNLSAIYFDAMEKANGDMNRLDLKSSAAQIAPDMASYLLPILETMQETQIQGGDISATFMRDLILQEAQRQKELDLVTGRGDNQTIAFAREIGRTAAVLDANLRNAQDAPKEGSEAYEQIRQGLETSAEITRASNAAREANIQVRKVVSQYAGEVSELYSASKERVSQAITNMLGADADGERVNNTIEQLGLENFVDGDDFDPRSETAPQARMFGGPVTADTPYLVGEKGAELFVPNQSGKIISADMLKSASQTSMQAMSPDMPAINTNVKVALNNDNRRINDLQTQIQTSVNRTNQTAMPSNVMDLSTAEVDKVMKEALQTKESALKSMKNFERTMQQVIRMVDTSNRYKYLD